MRTCQWLHLSEETLFPLRIQDKVACHPTVAMGHLCLMDPFTKMVALEGSGLMQWFQL